VVPEQKLRLVSVFKANGEAGALTFTTLIIANLGLIFANRSWTRLIFSTLRTPNRAFMVGERRSPGLSLPGSLYPFPAQSVPFCPAAPYGPGHLHCRRNMPHPPA
jgi:hypothetical protein